MTVAFAQSHVPTKGEAPKFDPLITSVSPGPRVQRGGGFCGLTTYVQLFCELLGSVTAKEDMYGRADAVEPRHQQTKKSAARRRRVCLQPVSLVLWALKLFVGRALAFDIRVSLA